MTATATQVQERPILFSGPIVRAILDGRKTQTRRVIKPQPESDCVSQVGENGGIYVGQFIGDMNHYWIPCPYGKVGDRLWVREAFSESFKRNPDTREFVHYKWSYRADEEVRGVGGVFICGDRKNGKSIKTMADLHVWKPSIHMPREASRITLEISNIRIERLQDISEEDAKAEGVGSRRISDPANPDTLPVDSYRMELADLWNKINTKHRWEDNPWVWVVEFKTV